MEHRARVARRSADSRSAAVVDGAADADWPPADRTLELLVAETWYVRVAAAEDRRAKSCLQFQDRHPGNPRHQRRPGRRSSTNSGNGLRLRRDARARTVRDQL